MTSTELTSSELTSTELTSTNLSTTFAPRSGAETGVATPASDPSGGPFPTRRRFLRLPFTQDQWRQKTEWPITGFAVVFLVAYGWSVIADLKGVAEDDAEWVMWSIWLIFVVDYVVSLILADRRWHWFFTHIPQFLVVALPALRPLRLLRLISLLSVLQRAAGMVVRGKVTVYVAGSAVLIVIISSLAELEAERGHPGATIKSYGDALWWSLSTITTVGYGDVEPTTLEGRAIAVGLMIAGIGLLGVVTATLASWMVERVSVNDATASRVTIAHIDALSEQVQKLSDQLAAATNATGAHATGTPTSSAQADAPPSSTTTDAPLATTT